jgi:hypothetical protein
MHVPRLLTSRNPAVACPLCAGCGRIRWRSDTAHTIHVLVPLGTVPRSDMNRCYGSARYRDCTVHPRPAPGPPTGRPRTDTPGRRAPQRLTSNAMRHAARTLAMLALTCAACDAKKARKARPKPARSDAATAQRSAEAAVKEWVAGMIEVNGTSPEVLRAALASVAGVPTGQSQSSATALPTSERAFGLPSHAHSPNEDVRLREPLMSKDAVQEAWGWYSGSLSEPASLPSSVVAQYRNHGHVLLRGFFNPRELLEMKSLLEETTAAHAHEYPKWTAEMVGSDQPLDPDTPKQFVRVCE